MAMVISSRAKGMIGAFICLILLSAALVTASTKGWLFGLNKNNGEHVAARIQVRNFVVNTHINDEHFSRQSFVARFLSHSLPLLNMTNFNKKICFHSNCSTSPITLKTKIVSSRAPFSF